MVASQSERRICLPAEQNEANESSKDLSKFTRVTSLQQRKCLVNAS